MDTSVISNLYMQRPGVIAHYSLGKWFCLALELRHPELANASLKRAKEIILRDNLNNRDDLERELKEFNAIHTEK